MNARETQEIEQLMLHVQSIQNEMGAVFDRLQQLELQLSLLQTHFIKDNITDKEVTNV